MIFFNRINTQALFILMIILATPIVTAQTSHGVGLKAGLNYNANGDYFESINANAQNPDRNVGYHLGIFGKIGNRFYFKPELVYTATKSDYDNDSFKLQKLDAPLLVGLKVLGPISIFGGPSLQYILDSKFNDTTISDIENELSIGLNFGIALNFKRIGIDLRYERGFSDNEASFLGKNGINTNKLDTRSNQLILSLSLLL